MVPYWPWKWDICSKYRKNKLYKQVLKVKLDPLLDSCQDSRIKSEVQCHANIYVICNFDYIEPNLHPSYFVRIPKFYVLHHTLHHLSSFEFFRVSTWKMLETLLSKSNIDIISLLNRTSLCRTQFWIYKILGLVALSVLIIYRRAINSQ